MYDKGKKPESCTREKGTLIVTHHLHKKIDISNLIIEGLSVPEECLDLYNKWLPSILQ